MTRKRTTRKRCGCWNEYESACTFGMKCAKRVTDRGKKGMLGYCVEAVLQRVEAEIRFSRERQEYPERYAGSSDDRPLAVWTSNNNKMEIAELMLGIYLAKVLRTPDGMLMEYREVIRLAERAFGVKISNHRELKRDIFKRTNELVIFLKRLIFLIEQERDKKDA